MLPNSPAITYGWCVAHSCGPGQNTQRGTITCRKSTRMHRRLYSLSQSVSLATSDLFGGDIEIIGRKSRRCWETTRNLHKPQPFNFKGEAKYNKTNKTEKSKKSGDISRLNRHFQPKLTTESTSTQEQQQ
ncbi:hypothetical protein CHS0354_007602 [Potamilus streckersoni]|uniref:Uncharacterized protein n=1 Tax=Potamilus streckersoni TaxID=2493646 RepID=A0AAE0W6H1_9BIVA|nr:hypothetical protein CHS0354_007602 [Potamilus streckersoni]